MKDTMIPGLLRALRLSEYEAKSYLSLLEKNSMSVSECSKVAGIPRTNAYEALEKLLAKGLCLSLPGKMKRYCAADPAVLEEKVSREIEKGVRGELEALERRRKEIIAERNESLKNLTTLIHELTPRYTQSQEKHNPLEFIEVIKDPILVHRRLMHLSRGAGVEILGFSKPPYSERKLLDEQVEEQHRRLKKGVKLRAIYEIPEKDGEKKDLLHNIQLVTKRGEESRVIKWLPLKMMIFDERNVLVALEDPVSREPSLTSLVIDHQSLAKALKIVFETMWQLAEDHHVLKNS